MGLPASGMSIGHFCAGVVEDSAQMTHSLVLPLKIPAGTTKAPCERAKLQQAGAAALHAGAESADGHCLLNWTWRPDINVANGTLYYLLLLLAHRVS